MSRVVAITGACTETAVAAAREFARRGDAVALLSRTPASVDAATTLVRDLGAQGLGLVVDTTDPDAVESAVDRIEEALGEVDVWVNTADDPGSVHFDDLCPMELRRVTDLLYLGHVHTTMTALERMKERESGTVVHVTSPLSWRGQAGRAAESGAAAALRGFHEAVAAELREEDSPVRLVLVEQTEDARPSATAHTIVQAARRHDRRARILRAGAIGTGAAVAAGTAAALRRRSR
ncbi:SDR family NAD(P)-dependent oxidoreductase [Phycicoccus flavus]|uniref:SDR family NAD(P)-dependent oxidoreductase n=1 Tax=Phycicoccus flavus TaxID=2502783 RepID=UPI000FEB9BAF|nr:SDR family NAD(P)-dependent oxidoreductase [Phycicoccus flavus]NHA66501.1 SDR family NAD(P)-dependent oxidoreductase [Phycicoccus flavus]